MRDPEDSSPTYYFLPLLSPALHPSAAVEVVRGRRGVDGQLRGTEEEQAYDEESPTLPPLPMSKHDTPTRKTKRQSTITSKTGATLQPQQHHAHSSPIPTPSSRPRLPNPNIQANTQANNPLPPLSLHVAPSFPETSTSLSTHLAASRTWGRGAGRDDAGGRYNVPRKPLAVRKDTGYLNNHNTLGDGNVMTLKGLEVERQRERERQRIAKEVVVRREAVGMRQDVGNEEEREKENRRPSDITEMEMEFDGEGGEDVTPEDEDDDAEGYVGLSGTTGGGVRYPKVPRECAMVWSRARGATWD